MFFEAAFEGKNQWWRYLVMFILTLIVASGIGGIPMIISNEIAEAVSSSDFVSDPDIVSNLYKLGISKTIILILLCLPFVVSLFAFIMLIKPLNSRTFTTVINGTSSIRWRRIFLSFGLWAIFFMIYLIIDTGLHPDNFSLNNTGPSLIMLALVSLLFIPFQSSFEEIIFRGYLMQGFGVAFKNKWIPLFTTSLIFGLLHVANPEVKEFGFLTMMPQYIFFGFVFGLITVLDNGIELAIGAHAANNIFLSVFVTNKAAAFQTDALYEQHKIFPWTEFMYLAIISVIFILVLSYIYKWKADAFLLKANLVSTDEGNGGQPQIP